MTQAQYDYLIKLEQQASKCGIKISDFLGEDWKESVKTIPTRKLSKTIERINTRINEVKKAIQ